MVIYFKVESIRTQYSDYASFKIVAPISLKNILLNKDNWAENIGYEPADLTVHPPPQNCRGWVHFFRIGV